MKPQNIVVLLALLFAGCSSNPNITQRTEQSVSAPRSIEIHGQILVGENGQTQKTGQAPIWVYDATDVQLTSNIALPDFGGRTRTDLARVRAEYPTSLIVYSNYDRALQNATNAEMAYRAANQKYWDKKKALDGQTSGPDFEEVQKLEAETKKASEARWEAWDENDDQSELIFYWFNVNPGIIYTSMPAPFTVIRTDTNGDFNLILPPSKKVLLAAHVQGSTNGQPEHYFWLLPVSSETTSSNLVLNNENIHLVKKNSEAKSAMIYSETGIGIGVGAPHRIRDKPRLLKIGQKGAPENHPVVHPFKRARTSLPECP